MPAKCLLVWRGCVCTLKNRVRGLLLHQLQFPVLCLIHSPLNPRSSQEGNDVYSTEPFPKLCRLRMVSCVHWCLCVGRTGYMWAHIPVHPQNVHTPPVKDCDPVKSSQPSGHSWHSSSMPPFWTLTMDVSVSSTKLGDLSHCLAQAWHLVGA